MKLQTKCTWVIIGLLVIEILPVPFTSLYSLYAVRKRPLWISNVTEKLYEESETDDLKNARLVELTRHDPMAVRKRCTIGLAAMFAVDLLVPVVIPTALYVVRKRPRWFKNLVVRLYADHHLAISNAKTHEQPHVDRYDPFVIARAEQKLVDLEKKNVHFAKSQTRRQLRTHNHPLIPRH